jgi:hypothetical protein
MFCSVIAEAVVLPKIPTSPLAPSELSWNWARFRLKEVAPSNMFEKLVPEETFHVEMS